MDKARRRFANLQQELSNVQPSDRRYQVNILKKTTKFKLVDKVLCSIHNLSMKLNFVVFLHLYLIPMITFLLGDSESNNSRI